MHSVELAAANEEIARLKQALETQAEVKRYEGAKMLLNSIAGKYGPDQISTKVCLVLAHNLEQIRKGKNL